MLSAMNRIFILILFWGCIHALYAQEPVSTGINADIQAIVAANQKSSAKDTVGALKAFEAVLAKFKGYRTAAENQLKQISSQLGQVPAVEPSFPDQASLDQDLTLATQYYQQAKAEIGKNSLPTAYTPALEAVRGFQICTAEMHYSVAMVQYQLKKYSEAMANLDQAILLKPNYVDAYIQRGWVRQHIRDTDLNESYNDFTAAIQFDPKNVLARYHRAQLMFNLQMDHDAVKELDKAIEIKPDYSDAICLRGMVKLVLCMEDTTWVDKGCADIERAAKLGNALAQSKYKDFCATPQLRKEHCYRGWQQGERERQKKREAEQQYQQNKQH